MATLNIGKLRVNWKAAYNNSTAYEPNDAVSSGGNSYICILASQGNAVTNATYWNVMAQGTSALTTSGDLLTYEGSAQVRKPIGASGHVLKSTGTTVAYSPESGYTGHKHLLTNYGHIPAKPNASTTYGVDGKYPWLANYAQGWIPECGTPSPACGPIKNASYGHHVNGYRITAWLNQNHELVVKGDDDYWMGSTHANRHDMSVVCNISQQDGGMRDGDYFVRFWISYNNIMCLTKDGDLFTAGDNVYGQLGNGKTTDSYILTKVSTLGPNATHGGVSTQIACFHYSNTTDYGSAMNTSCYAIDTSGRLFVWGYNGSGKLGIGNASSQLWPVHATNVSNVVSVSAGHISSHCIDSSGNLFRTGLNQHGINQGTSVTSWTDTNQDNVWCIENHDGHGLGVVYASAYYINTSGEMYAIAHNNHGTHGNGNTTATNQWVRTGGTLTFSSFYISGNSLYWSMSGLGGTPNSPNTKFYNWGYNSGGQLGQGNVTHLYTPTQPSTTSKFTFTTASTASNNAPTRTNVAVPVDAIAHIHPFYGCTGQGHHGVYMEDTTGHTWTAGYGNNMDVHDTTTAVAVNFNYYMDPAPWNTTSSTSGFSWHGQSQVSIVSMWNTGTGAGSSEGCFMCATSDGRVWGKGYNVQGQLSSDGNWVEQWMQITP